MLWYHWALLIAFAIIGAFFWLVWRRPAWVSTFGGIVAAFCTVLLGLALVFVVVLPNTPALLATSTTAPSSLVASDLDAMKAELVRQFEAADKALADKVSELDTAVKAVTDKDIEQDNRLAALEKRTDTLEQQMAVAKADIKALRSHLQSIETGDVTVTGTPSDLTTDQASQALANALVAQGWQPSEINVGKVDWSKNPVDNGRETFVNRQIRTQQDLARVLSQPQNRAEKTVRKHILESLKGMPESERQRALSGEGFVPVQFLEAACFDGNTFYANGKAHREAGTVCKRAGDVWWVYVGSDGKVYWDTSVRADCGNPGIIKPPRPEKPKPPTTKPPTSPPTSPPTTSTPTPTPSCPPGKYCKPKKPAPQPTGVEKPTGNPVGSPTAKPSPKATPLEPKSSTQPTSAAPVDNHEDESKQDEGGTPTSQPSSDG